MIPAGGSGTLSAKIKVKPGSTGTHTKTVTVHTDSAVTPTLRLSLGYTAVNPITAAPNFRLYLNMVEGEPGSAMVRLHRDDGEPLEARVVDSGLPEELEVTVERAGEVDGPSGAGDAGSGDLEVWAKIRGDASALNLNGVVALTTNHPKAARLEIPIYVRVRPLVEVRPASVKLWPPEGGPNGTSSQVRLSHSARQPFEVTGVEVSNPDLISAAVTTAPGQPIQAVKITLGEGVTTSGQPIAATVSISTSVAGKDRIEVPVLVVDRHEALRRRSPTHAAQPKPAVPSGQGGN